MVKAVGELALAGVGIIPAIEPSRGYTDMVPFNPLLYWENEKRVCCLFAWHSVLPGRDLLWLKPFGISFYKLLVLKKNDRNRVWSQFCCSENSEMYGKISRPPWSLKSRFLHCVGEHLRPIVCVIPLEDTFGKFLRWKYMVQMGHLLCVNWPDVRRSCIKHCCSFHREN